MVGRFYSRYKSRQIMGEALKNKIKQLSEEERGLVLRKLMQTMNQHPLDSSSEKPKRLVAYIEGDAAAIDINEIKSLLRERLPDYMIPSVMTVTDKIPLLPNGKVDKKGLQNLQKPPKKEEVNASSSELEQNLIQIWEEVLNFKPISVHDNFFEIGGDSILSIQIIARARKLGIELASNDLFDHQTIAEIALFSDKQKKLVKENDLLPAFKGPLPLSPIQHWFFETHKNAPHYWNQTMQLEGIRNLKEDTIKLVIDSIITKHNALRSSFLMEDDGWKAYIKAPSEIDSLRYIDVSDRDATNQQQTIDAQMDAVQSDFNLSEGSLFKCVYFKTHNDEANICFIVAHHLVVDALSWQIILDDLRTGLQQLSDGSTVSSNESNSILSWTVYLKEAAKSVELEKEESFWIDQTSNATPLPKDKVGILPLLEKDIKVHSANFNSSITHSLLDKANEAYKTKTDELLLAALTQTIGNWSQSKAVAFGVEKHGRETNSTTIDLTNTTGWFTAYFPIKLDVLAFESIEKGIIGVKEQLRTIPNGGIGYGVLRYLKKSLEPVPYPEIVFNFLGRQNSSEANDTIKAKSITQGTRHPESERYYALEINAVLVDDVLETTWSYSHTQYEEATIEKLITRFKENLKEIIAHCTSTDSGKYTPSDFPETSLNQDDLDSLFSTLE